MMISGRWAVAAKRWKRPGQMVWRVPRAMLSGVTRKPWAAELLGGGDGEGKIAELMAADQRRDDLHLLAQNTSAKARFVGRVVDERIEPGATAKACCGRR